MPDDPAPRLKDCPGLVYWSSALEDHGHILKAESGELQLWRADTRRPGGLKWRGTKLHYVEPYLYPHRRDP